MMNGESFDWKLNGNMDRIVLNLMKVSLCVEGRDRSDCRYVLLVLNAGLDGKPNKYVNGSLRLGKRTSISEAIPI